MIKPCTTVWISPPGETIADLLDERGWSKSELADRLGCTPKHVSQMLNGKAPIHAEMAAMLSRVLGSTPEFWLQREAQYRAALERIASNDALAGYKDWLRELPVRWMVKEKLVPEHLDKGTMVEETLRFFGVASVPAWREVYGGHGAAFRTSARLGKKHGSVATWLRRAEIEAEKIHCQPWSEGSLKALLPQLRELTLEIDPQLFLPRLVDACAGVGVATVFVPTPPGCPASGATRWLTPDKALVILSLRYKTNDHLWFTFFHEIGHILLHSKKVAFLEGMEGLDSRLEKEADDFSADLLIPPKDAEELPRLKTQAAVRKFAARIGVHPGIVVGRLQKEGHVAWSAMNGLKQRYEWEGNGSKADSNNT